MVSTEEAERYVKEFNRDMERGDLPSTTALLDDTVDYYAFGPKDKAFVAEQLRQYFALVPVRAFVVGDVKVQPGPKPTVVTVIFDTLLRARCAWNLKHRPHPDRMGPGATPRWPQDRSHQLDDVSRRHPGALIHDTNRDGNEWPISG